MASSSVKRAPALAKETTVAISNLESMWSKVDTIRTKLNGECLHTRPENSFTRNEYCERFNIAPNTAKDQLASMVRRKLIKLVKVMLPSRTGSVVAHNVYIPLSDAQ